MKPTPLSPVIFTLSGVENAWLGIGVTLLAIVGLQLAIRRRLVWDDVIRALRSHNPRFRQVLQNELTNRVG